MALWAYALRTVSQAKDLLGITGQERDVLVEACVNQASRMVEGAWGRHLVSRGSLTEYHVADPSVSLDHELWLNEWPIVMVTSVHEDAERSFGASTLLTVTTDYVVSKPQRLVRVSSSLRTSWVTAWRGIKVVYTAGYQNTAGSITGADTVPDDVLAVFDELLDWLWKFRTGGGVGLTTVSDATGNRTFIGAPFVTPGMRARLMAAGACPVSLSGRTGERDS